MAAAAACGSPPQAAAPTSSAPASTAEPKGTLPPSPIDEARRLLADASTTSDAHERCRMLQEAAILDPSSREARLARAQSRCAPASDLLSDARAAHAKQADTTSATVLATVATRAGSRDDALAAVTTLLAGDVAAKALAASTLARFGEHARAADVYQAVAAERADKGATVDAIDARLEAVVERARAGDAPKAREALLAVVTDAAHATKGYGAAWIGPKVVTAIAALRNAGDAKGAAAVAAKAHGAAVFTTPEARAAHDLERAIAAARAGNVGPATALSAAAKARTLDRPSRALLAVHARAAGSCANAKAHARAWGWLSGEGVRLDEDVAWARACEAKPSTAVPTTVVPPAPSDDVADAIAIAAADPLRARARVQSILAVRPDDVAAHLAAIELALPADRAKVAERAASAIPAEPWIQLARVVTSASSDGAALVKALAGTIEAKVPRATAPILARAVLAPRAPDADLAEALVRACGASTTGACLDLAREPALARATATLRTSRPAVLASVGPRLSNVDLTSRTRLDVVLALLSQKDVGKAQQLAGPSRGAWSGPESRLAQAVIAAAQKKCLEARAHAAYASDLKEYADVLARIDACE